MKFEEGYLKEPLCEEVIIYAGMWKKRKNQTWKEHGWPTAQGDATKRCKSSERERCLMSCRRQNSKRAIAKLLVPFIPLHTAGKEWEF